MLKNKVFLTVLLAAILSGVGYAQTEEEAIAKTIKQFLAAGDQQDAANLDQVLHTDFRLLWHDGNKAEIFNADRATFLSQFEKKEWGGDKRQVSIEQTNLFSGSNAMVKVISKGSKAEMNSLFALVKVEDDWKIVQELVTAEFK